MASLPERIDPRRWGAGRRRSTGVAAAFFRGAPLAALLCAIAARAAPPPSSRPHVPLGAGLEPIVDWARTNVFVDLVKQSRGFGPPDSADPSTAIPVDARGWPRGDFGVILWTSAAEVRGLGGTYKVSFDGRAAIAPLASDAAIQNLAYHAGTDTTTADVIVNEGSENLWLSFRGTTRGVRNLKVLRPGYDANETFTLPFKKHLARFSVLRFMDWGNTNNNPVQRWSERSLPSDPRYSKGIGVPWEVDVQLANELHKDMWINVPIAADDDYVRKLAELLKARLDPALNVYVEYSNEVWNFQFKQAQTNVDLAKAGVARGGSPLNADGASDPYVWGWRRVALRLKQISDIFASVYGRGAINTVVRPVLAGQVVAPHVAREGLDLIQRTYGSPRRFFYAVAGAPYFDMGVNRKARSVDQIIGALSRGVDDCARVNAFDENAALARWYGLPFLAYEGGPDTFGPASVAAKKAAQFDPRMKDLVVRYLNNWYAYGFGLFSWFVAGATRYDTEYGAWGLTDDMTRLDTPKVQGLDAVLAAPRTPLTAGSPIPGEVDARAYVGARQPFADPYLTGLGTGDSRDYLVRAPADASYRVQVNAAAGDPGARVAILVNNAAVSLQDVPQTRSDSTFRYLAPVAVQLTAGLNVIRLQAAEEGFNVKSIRLGN